MKNQLIIIAIASLGFTAPGNASAQLQQSGYTTEQEITVSIPPLGAILDSALAKNEMIKFRELGITGKQSNLTSYKNYWTRNIGVQADVRYGTFNNFSTNTSEGQTSSIYATSTNQTVYGIGVYMKFPLQDIVDRKSQIIMAKSELEQAKSMAGAQRDEVRQQVIKQYNDVIMKQRVLTIKSRNLSSSRVNMEMTEKEFRNGNVSVTEYTRISDIVADIESEYEVARADFLTSYMILEEVAGYRFN